MRSIAPLLPPLLLLSACAATPPSSTELERLRVENAQLRQQVAAQQAAQQAVVPAPVVPAPSAPAASMAAAPSGRTLDLSLPAGTPTSGYSAPAPPPSAETTASAAPAAPAAPYVVPQGFRLIKEPDKYSQTGCTSGLLGTTPEAGWKYPENWAALQKGDSTQTVEGLIGIDHYNVESGSSLIWQYGKCGHNVNGYVVFEKNAVVRWSTPDF